jgi:predicted ester cyclase
MRRLRAPGAQVSGRDNVTGFLAVFQEAFPDLRLEIEQLLTDGSAAAAEGTLTGAHHGVLHSPNGDVAPTGRAVELRWAALYVIDGDTLKSEHLFFDQMDFLGQLGLLRTPSATNSRREMCCSSREAAAPPA